MSESKQFRSKTINISPAVYEAAKALSEIEGYSCPDELCDIRLGLLLSTEADIQWLIVERRKALEGLSKRYRDRIAGKDSDAIPGL